MVVICVSIFFSLVALSFLLKYHRGVSITNDYFFPIRRKLFFKKIKKEGYDSIFDYFSNLLDTKQTHWEKPSYPEYQMEHYKEDGIKVVYEDIVQPIITLYANDGHTKLFSLYSDYNFHKISFNRDQLKKTKLSFTKEKELQKLFKHVASLYSLKEIERKEMLEKEKKELKEKRERDTQSYREILLNVLRKKKKEFSLYRYKGFKFEVYRYNGVNTLSIDLNGESHFKYQLFKRTGETKINVYPKYDPITYVFKFLEKELIEFANFHFSLLDKSEVQKKQKEKESVIFKNKLLSSTDDFSKRIEELKKEKKWLSAESYYQLNKAIPAELSFLIEKYEKLPNKEQQQERIEASLLKLTIKLDNMIKEIEENKKLELKKLQHVIKIR